MQRRAYLRAVGALGVAGLAGCSGDGGSDGSDDGGESGDNVVEVGPGGALVFEPESLTIAPEGTVTWEFVDPGHNVSCDPDDHDSVSLPDGADPFVSYEGDNQFNTNDEGTSFEYTFSETGTYEYLCVPHAANGMRGTILVEE